MSEVRERYGRVADGFGARLRGVRPEQWGLPTPCTEWDVRALVAHVTATHGRVVAAVSGLEPPEIDTAGDLPAQWEAVREAVAGCLADPARASAVVGGMFGEQSFESLVSRLLCADTLFHTWDLAQATGQDHQLDADACEKALAFLEPLDEAIRRPGGFGPKIASPPGAAVQDRLLSFGGREER